MATAVTSVPGPQPVCIPPGTARPRLRLVGPGERALCEHGLREHGLREHGLREHGPDGVVECGEDACLPALQGVRLTRRGRIVITLVAALAVAALAVALANSVDAAAPQIAHATTVSAGQTLSGVASAQLPGLPIADAVARIQLVNGLNTSQVHAGQSLLIPQMP